ncbi:MAG: helix-turn-helix domain-containing protein [Chloroflexota bacterium]|nr:helix-turn-helix domain-containing protein [Chloroflexota bacterium]
MAEKRRYPKRSRLVEDATEQERARARAKLSGGTDDTRLRNQALGRVLYKARMDAGLTLKECAELVGTEEKRYSAMERGASWIKAAELEVLVRALRIPYYAVWPIEAKPDSSPPVYYIQNPGDPTDPEERGEPPTHTSQGMIIVIGDVRREDIPDGLAQEYRFPNDVYDPDWSNRARLWNPEKFTGRERRLDPDARPHRAHKTTPAGLRRKRKSNP